MSREDGATKVLGCFGLIALGAITIVVSALLNGWAITKLWAWFIVPAFRLPELSLTGAIGMALIVGFITNHGSGNGEKEKQEVSEIVAKGISFVVIRPLTAVAFGWLILKFV